MTKEILHSNLCPTVVLSISAGRQVESDRSTYDNY